ncbi:MAG: bifunctional heptose 7-phosphate kinase/heptose 1-phosphate adenyltransferase [Desulfovibrio sp.]
MVDKQSIISALGTLSGKKVLIIGDMMLDHYVIGSVDRISPEAPVPVVQVSDEKYLLGGAGNVARNIVALGGEPLLVSRCGVDAEADHMRKLCADAGFGIELFEEKERPTTKKTRVMTQGQQIVRIDNEINGPMPQPKINAMIEFIKSLIDQYDVVILSDYGKGVICQDFMNAFMELMDSVDKRPYILVDPKTVNYDLYKGVDFLTPNTKEAAEGAGTVFCGDQLQDEVLQIGKALYERLSCSQLLITLGAQGMALFLEDGKVRHIPTFAKKVFDVTGAGDTVIAAYALAYAAGCSFEMAATIANYAAGISVGQVGAATASVEEIIRDVDAMPEVRAEEWTA